MKARLARAGAAAILVLVMAVTPLSTVLSGGRLETWLPGDRLGSAFVHVTMYDQTGLVRTISAAAGGDFDRVSNPAGNTYLLEVSWFGTCGDRETQLALRRSPTGYALTERTTASGCRYLILVGRSVAIHLWSPIDASTVTFSSSR